MNCFLSSILNNIWVDFASKQLAIISAKQSSNDIPQDLRLLIIPS